MRYKTRPPTAFPPNFCKSKSFENETIVWMCIPACSHLLTAGTSWTRDNAVPSENLSFVGHRDVDLLHNYRYWGFDWFCCFCWMLNIHCEMMSIIEVYLVLIFLIFAMFFEFMNMATNSACLPTQYRRGRWFTADSFNCDFYNRLHSELFYDLWPATNQCRGYSRLDNECRLIQWEILGFTIVSQLGF